MKEFIIEFNKFLTILSKLLKSIVVKFDLFKNIPWQSVIIAFCP